MASPYTYDQLKARQKAIGPTGSTLPVKGVPAVPLVPPTEANTPTEPEVAVGATPDEASFIDTPALDDSVESVPADTAVAPVSAQTNPRKAKRAVVLNAARNSVAGRALYAKHLRAMYSLPPTSKLTDDEVIQSAYDVQSQKEPGLDPHDFEKDLHTAFGSQVDRAILKQAHEDYPGITDEGALIDRMYRAKLRKEELPALTYEDKAQIIARRFPKLHASALEPDEALRRAYKLEKVKGRDIGSFDDWVHTMAAPTTYEKMLALGGGIAKGLAGQVHGVGEMVHEASDPAQLASDIALATHAGDSPAGQAAKQRLIDAGKGAITVGSFAAGPAVGAGLKLAEGAAGAAQTAPLLSGALEGGVIGGAQSGGEAAIEGKPLGDVAAAATGGAGAGLGLGALAGAIHGNVVKGAALREADAAAAELAARKAAGAADLSAPAETPAMPPPPTDPMELAARAQAEHRWGTLVSQFAKDHDMEPTDVHALVDPEVPPTADLAAANMRHGVSIDDINKLKELQPEHLKVEAQAPPPETPTPAAPAATGAPQVVPPAPSAPATRPDAGVAQTPVSERMTEALNRAQGQLGERRNMIREQRSARLAKARAAFEAAGKGLPGLRAKLSMMAGEMEKPEWDGVKDLFSDLDRGSLHTAIGDSQMLEGDKLSAHAGLERLLQGSRAGAPTLSQIRALRLAFGDQFADAALSNSPQMAGWLQALHKTLNTPRTIMTSLDLSAGMRQGYLMTSQPGYWRAWKEMMKAAGPEHFAVDAAQAIKDDHLYDVMRESGVYFQGPQFKAPSETFAGSWVDNAPGIKNSQAAYDTFINQTRANVFKDFYETAMENGVQVTDPQFRKSLAHWINTGTGRGNLAFLGRDANLLNTLAFSPRLAWSRFETFNPLYYKSLHPSVRAAALKANMSTIGATTGLITLMGASGLAKVATDPRNSDFGKLRFGNTRIDMFGGHQQLARMMAQLTTGKVISSTTGREIDLNGSDEKNGFTRGAMNRADVIARFMEAKAAPLASLALAVLRGKDFLGRPISMPNEIATRLTPMPIEDIADAVKDGGWKRGAIVAPAALVGLGTQTYNASLPKAAGGEEKPDMGVAMNAGSWLWNRLNGLDDSPSELTHLNAHLAEQWVKDAAAAQVVAHHDATLKKGFFDPGFDQNGEIRKATARRMARINKLYKDLSGANGEGPRMRANQDLLTRRADATGVDADALENPQSPPEK